MAKRLEKINSTLQKEISTIISERFQGKYGLITVSAVQISADLRQAKVWLSADETAINDLNIHRKDIISHLRPRLRMKYIPSLIFLKEDDSINRIDELLEQIDES